MDSSPDIEFLDNAPVTIIGSSGRNELISFNIFEDAKNKCIEYLKNLSMDIEDIILQSGGSSGVDHIAVVLFLEGIDGRKFAGLELFLPCKFDFYNKKFLADNKYTESASNTLNELHTKFSVNIKRDSFEDFKKIKDMDNVNIHYGFGFYARNRMLAEKSDTTLAMTFGKNSPNDGGTRYTWDLIKGTKTHIGLNKFT